MPHNTIRNGLAAFTVICSFAAPLAEAQTMAPATPVPSTMTPMKTTTTHSVASTIPHFTTVAAAKSHCPSDTVVWSSLSHSKSYHLASSKYFGKTKHGAYVCKQDATTAGFHASKV